MIARKAYLEQLDRWKDEKIISGRYVEINMLPFSFDEYLEATGRTDTD